MKNHCFASLPTLHCILWRLALSVVLVANRCDVVTCGILPTKDGYPGENEDSSIVSLFRRCTGNANNDSLVRGLTADDDDTRISSETALIGVILSYTIAFGTLLVLFCCIFFPDRMRGVAVAPHQTDAVSRVLCKAGFQGLLRTERIRILKHVLEPIVWSNSDEEQGESETKSDPIIIKHNDSFSSTNDETDHALMCSICLNPYQPNDCIMRGQLCRHIFHYDCCLQWLSTHDQCPYCRQDFITDHQFRQAALVVLGESRVRSAGGLRIQVNEQAVDRNNNARTISDGQTDSHQPISAHSAENESEPRQESVEPGEDEQARSAEQANLDCEYA